MSLPELPVAQDVVERHRVATGALAEARARAAKIAAQAEAVAALEATVGELDELHRVLLATVRLLLGSATEQAAAAVAEAARQRAAARAALLPAGPVAPASTLGTARADDAATQAAVAAAQTHLRAARETLHALTRRDAGGVGMIGAELVRAESVARAAEERAEIANAAWREAHEYEAALGERLAQLRRIVADDDDAEAVERAAAGVWAMRG